MKNMMVALVIVAILFLLSSFVPNDYNYTIIRRNNSLSYSMRFRESVSVGKYLIEIKNTSSGAINFGLGLNDMLFPDKQSVLQYIMQGDVNNGLSPAVTDVYKKMIRENDDEEYYRAFLFLIPRTFHHFEMTDQYASSQWAQSPMLMINSFGFGTCGTHARVLSKIWQALGYRTRERHLYGHAVSEVFNGERWLVFDSDKKAYYFDENFKIIGIDELKRNPSLIFPDKRIVAYGLPYYEFPQSGPGRVVKDIIVKSKGSWLKPIGTPSSETDWIPLNITLPSKATFSFPFEGEDIFFAENIDFVSQYGKKVLTPKYKYAVLEIDKGTTGKINVGLYPFKIEGECNLIIEGLEKQLEGKDFDQIKKYRSERIFAKTITFTEAKSSVRIYYLLNNYSRLLRSNKLLIIGGETDKLSVAFLKKREKEQRLDRKEETGSEKKYDGLTEIIPKYVYSSSKNPNKSEFLRFLIDGKVATSWTSDLVEKPEPIGIVFDFGESCLLAKVEWLGSIKYPFTSPSEFTVALSEDGEKYEEMVKKSDPENRKMVWHEVEMSQHWARYVKIIVVPVPHPNQGFFQAGLGEVKFFIQHHDQN